MLPEGFPFHQFSTLSSIDFNIGFLYQKRAFLIKVSIYNVLYKNKACMLRYMFRIIIMVSLGFSVIQDYKYSNDLYTSLTVLMYIIRFLAGAI